MKNKTVYISLSVDLLHHGHINLINHAKKYGKVTAGLLTDSAIQAHKRIPLLNFNQRKKILENINGISNVVSQNEYEYGLFMRFLNISQNRLIYLHSAFLIN